MSASLPADLSRIDPVPAWEAWKPDDRDPWNARQAAHLLRRAAFGSGPEQIATAVRDGFEPTVKRLLAGKPGHEKTDKLLADIGERFASQGDLDAVRGWWVYSMLNSGHPLREKLTLFWHNHFATSVVKVRSVALMYRQNQLLRKHALGEFRPFLSAMGRDAAMLIWLDSNQNVKSHPNENYARELMELFTLGVGHYSEKDVKEAARAYTGWHTNEDQTAWEFNKSEHDDGMKTVLGRTGRWDGESLLDVLLDQPACARFIVGKLYRELISETAPPPALLEPLCKRFRSSGYKISDLTGVMIRSRLFFSTHAFLSCIKSPAEFVLGAVQAAWPGPARPAFLAEMLGKMGQNLFAPPNVKGWRGGRAWLNTATLLARNNFAEQVAMGAGFDSAPRVGVVPLLATKAPEEPPAVNPSPAVKHEPRDPAAKFDVAARFSKIDPTKYADLGEQLLEVFLPGCASATTRKQIASYLEEGKPTGAHLRERIREAAHAILCGAEYQLC
jgi:hypothetical protein